MTRRPRLRSTIASAVMAGVVCAPPAVHAQSAQPYAIQLSAMFTQIPAGAGNVAGQGVELQQRFNRLYTSETIGAVSLGIGGQYTVHRKVRDELRIAGIFIEPRWVPATPSGVIFPYLSARLAWQHMQGIFQFAEDGSTTGSSYGAGGGIALRIARHVNIDAGAQLVRQRFGKVGALTLEPINTYAAKVGLSVGYP